MYYKTLSNILISTLKEHQGYGGYPYGGGCGCNQCGGGYGAGYGGAIILVLFILLVIVIGARSFGFDGR